MTADSKSAWHRAGPPVFFKTRASCRCHALCASSLLCISASHSSSPSPSNRLLPPTRKTSAFASSIRVLKNQLTPLTENGKRGGTSKTIAGLLKRSTTIPMLPAEELKKMWVTGNLRIGNFSGGADLDPNKPGDEGFQAYLTPLDENDATRSKRPDRLSSTPLTWPNRATIVWAAGPSTPWPPSRNGGHF